MSKKNSIPLCMMPFIGNMMTGKPENGDVPKPIRPVVAFLMKALDKIRFMGQSTSYLELYLDIK